MPETIQILFIAILGLIFGSFLNVVILRIPAGQSITHPPSRCPHCNELVRWWQNIPIVSYLILRGQCFHCKNHISLRYPVIEAITSLLFVVLFLFFGWSYSFLYYTILILFLIPIAVIDWEHFLIFDIISVPGIIIGIGLPLVVTIPGHSFINALGGAIIAALSLALIRILGNKIFKKDTMGLGDIRLAGLVGAFLGLEIFLLNVFTTSILILIVASFAGLLKFTKMTNKYPFGFYFSISAAINIFYGNELINAYLNIAFKTG